MQLSNRLKPPSAFTTRVVVANIGDRLHRYTRMAKINLDTPKLIHGLSPVLRGNPIFGLVQPESDSGGHASKTIGGQAPLARTRVLGNFLGIFANEASKNDPKRKRVKSLCLDK